MRQSLGEISTLNIIIIFIVIVFGLLTATINYYKAFKLNSKILDIIEKYEGYNKFSREEIVNSLNTLGYTTNPGNWNCPTKNGNYNLVGSTDKEDSNVKLGTNDTDTPSHYYCIYYVPNDGSKNTVNGKSDYQLTNLDKEPIYYNYIVVTYIFVDLPVVGQFKIPVRTKGERTYNFSEKKGNPILG